MLSSRQALPSQLRVKVHPRKQSNLTIKPTMANWMDGKKPQQNNANFMECVAFLPRYTHISWCKSFFYKTRRQAKSHPDLFDFFHPPTVCSDFVVRGGSPLWHKARNLSRNRKENKFSSAFDPRNRSILVGAEIFETFLTG